MSEAKHTPGPWTYDKATETVCAGPTADSEFVIGRFEPASGPLAAAAPDTLAANIAFIEALIEAYSLQNANDDFIYDELGSSLAQAFFMARAAITKATGAA